MLNFDYVHQRKQRWTKKVLDETNQKRKGIEEENVIFPLSKTLIFSILLTAQTQQHSTHLQLLKLFFV